MYRKRCSNTEIIRPCDVLIPTLQSFSLKYFFFSIQTLFLNTLRISILPPVNFLFQLSVDDSPIYVDVFKSFQRKFKLKSINARIKYKSIKIQSNLKH